MIVKQCVTVWLLPLIAVANGRTDDDQDRPTLRGTNTSNPGSSFSGPSSPAFGAGFRQGSADQSFGGGFQQGGLRQQQFLAQQQFGDGSGPFQSGLQQGLLRPDLALLQQQNNNLRPNSFSSNSPFGSPLLNQMSNSGQFNQFGAQDFNNLRNPTSFQQQSLGLSPFQGQGLQQALGTSFQGQFPGQFEQQSPLLLALLQQQNSFDAQSQFGGRPQLNNGNLFESQRQLALQQSLLSQLGLVQQNPFQQQQGFSNDAQFGRPSRPMNQNTGSIGGNYYVIFAFLIA